MVAAFGKQSCRCELKCIEPRDWGYVCVTLALTDLDGRQSETVSPDISPTPRFKESSNITRHDRRKQDVLPLSSV